MSGTNAEVPRTGSRLMTIPTQMSLTGFIATTPQLTFTQSGIARFYARVGVDHYRREADGAWTKLDPTFHDLVMFRNKAEKAYERFRLPASVFGVLTVAT